MSVCNVLAYPAMSLWLNKTGRPILFSCSWPAYQEGQMKVSLIIQVCMLKEYATSHGLQSVPRSACWRPCVLPLCLCTSGHLMLSCWVAPPKSISAVGKPKLKLKNSLRRLTDPSTKFYSAAFALSSIPTAFVSPSFWIATIYVKLKTNPSTCQASLVSKTTNYVSSGK